MVINLSPGGVPGPFVMRCVPTASLDVATVRKTHGVKVAVNNV